MDEDSKFCSDCGTPVDDDPGAEEPVLMMSAAYAAPAATAAAAFGGSTAAGGGTVNMGFSQRINDPALRGYVKNANRYAAIFSIVIALIAVVSFYIAGERGVEGMSNPESLYIGFGIGGMFIVIALFQILGRKRSKTWDGRVIHKHIQRRQKKVQSGDDTRRQEVLDFNVIIESDRGKKHTISTTNDDTVYNYYTVGDRVRHHGGLNSYEKYDKTKDRIIFCSACATLCDIKENTCPRCKCPLLK
jgi:hypothetical protein